MGADIKLVLGKGGRTEAFSRPPTSQPLHTFGPAPQCVMVEKNNDEETTEPLMVVDLCIPTKFFLTQGLPFPGTSSFSLYPSLNLFSSNVTFSGLNWVEGLKNLNNYSRHGQDLGLSLLLLWRSYHFLL